MADSARAAGDPRSKGQVMADTLVDAVLDVRLGARRGSHPLGPDADHERRPRDPAPARGAGIELGLVMTDATLFGTSDEPAHVEGYGPIPAELAREIVAGACTREETVWLRRLYASPGRGELAGDGLPRPPVPRVARSVHPDS